MRRGSVWIIGLVLLLAVFLYGENNWIGVTVIEKEFENLPAGFDGFNIVQLSDIHNKAFGKGSKRLIEEVEDLEPDMVVVTGDLVDAKKGKINDSIYMMEELAKKYQVYFVSGNHEWNSKSGEAIIRALEDVGVKVLRNDTMEIRRKNSIIYMAGIDDPAMDSGGGYQNFEKRLKDLENQENKDEFSILLSHRPEKFDLYAAEGFDLSFCGHAHGGQFRIPLLGGLIAPNQGFFPKYTSGLYERQGSFMIVSRGLGNSIVPQRIFNRPQIISLVLHSKQE